MAKKNKKAAKKSTKPAAKRTRQYWLLKTEPGSYSIDDLASEPDKKTFWDGVRNYQARNFMRDDMRKGDLALFYHSNAKPPVVAGVAEIVREGYPDHTSWDPHAKHYDEKSTPQNPRWYMVDIKFKQKFSQPLDRDELRQHPELEKMELLRTGSRLSVQPVTPEEFDTILKIAKELSRK